MGISKVRITGGEPLLRKNLPFLIEAVRSIPEIQDLAITTNGLLLNEQASSLWEAGLRRLNVSMDSLDHEKFSRITGGGDLSLLQKGIKQTLDMGFYPIKINVVLMKGINDDEINDFAKLTLSFPFEIRFIEVMPTGNPLLSQQTFMPGAEVKEQIESTLGLLPLNLECANGPARTYKIPGALGKIGVISPMSEHFCKQCNRLRIPADGSLRTCLFSDAEIDLKFAIRDGCSDEDISAIIRMAVMEKPMKHGAIEDLVVQQYRPIYIVGG